MELFGLAIASWVGLYIWMKIKGAIESYRIEVQNEKLDIFSKEISKNIDISFEARLIDKQILIAKNSIDFITLDNVNGERKLKVQVNEIDDFVQKNVEKNGRCIKCEQGIMRLAYGVFGPYKRCNKSPNCKNWIGFDDV